MALFFCWILIASRMMILFQMAEAYYQSAGAIEWTAPEQCLKAGKIFNTVTMGCVECSEPNPAMHTECECSAGNKRAFYENLTNNQLKIESKCEKCPEGLAVSADGLLCVRCVDSEGKMASVHSASGMCQKCGDNEIVQYGLHTKANGSKSTPLATSAADSRIERCVPCPTGTSPDRTQRNCVPCETDQCICKINKEMCGFNPPETATALQNPDSGQSIRLAYLMRHLWVAEAECKSGNRRQCQHLANMCVLQDHSRDVQGGACSMLESLRQSLTDGQQTVPILFYQNSEASAEIFRENAIEATFSVNDGDSNSRLDIFSVVYALNGTVLGEYASDSGFLQICLLEESLASKAYRFGTYFYKICKTDFDFASGSQRQKSQSPEESAATEFIEIFIRYRAIDGRIMIYPIPIVNENVRDHFQPLNRIANLKKDSRVLLTRRFFMVDTQEYGNEEENRSMIRVPQSISLHIHPQPRDGYIYVPYLRIKHNYILEDRSGSNRSTAAAAEGSQKPPYFVTEFFVEYMTDSGVYEKILEITMATLCSASAMWAAMRAYSWGRWSGKLVVDGSTIAKFVVFAAENIGDVFLVVTGVISCGMYYAYKFQKHAVYFPLTHNQEESFVAYIIAATCLKAVSVVHCYVTLVLVETFFIDWERPRLITNNDNIITNTSTTAEEQRILKETSATTMDFNQHPLPPIEPKQQQQQIVVEKRSNQPVIWRTYLVANEWNELQGYRKISVSLQMVSLLFILDYLGLGNLSRLEPGIDISDNIPEVVRSSRMSRFAVDFSFYVLIALAQWLVQVFLVEKIADPFRNFMDLCSMANISVLAMPYPLRGYYIHGRSVHGMADTDMHEMNRFLKRERENLCSLRGLESGSEIQTFIVNMPFSFRERLNQILGGMMGSLRGNTTTKVEVTAMVHSESNEFLRDVVNHGDQNCDYTVQDSRLVEQILGINLADTSKTGSFTRDKSETAYSEAFVYGNEWTMTTFEGLLFCLLSMWIGSRVFAAFVTYSISTCLRKLSMVYFTKNLARTSLVDSRFLI